LTHFKTTGTRGTATSDGLNAGGEAIRCGLPACSAPEDEASRENGNTPIQPLNESTAGSVSASAFDWSKQFSFEAIRQSPNPIQPFSFARV